MDRPSRDDRWRPGRRSRGDALHDLGVRGREVLAAKSAIQLGTGMCETDRSSHCRLRKRDRRADRPHAEASREAIRRVTRQIAFVLCRVKSVGRGPTEAMTVTHRRTRRRPVPETRTHETLFDTRAAARCLGVSESFLAKARMNGTGPRYRKLGRSVRYAQADLDHWLLACSRTSTVEQPTVMALVRKPSSRA